MHETRSIDPFLTQSDNIVLKNLLQEINHGEDPSSDEVAIVRLAAINDPTSDTFKPTIFTSWDLKESPASTTNNASLLEKIRQRLLASYISWASGVVRLPTDVVFLSHIILYLSTSVPSATYLYYNFTWPHGLCHWLMQAYYCGPFTLMLHNHIHNNGILSSSYAWLDKTFPYILEPLMGHTWDSYYYHHVKHHHVEANGPHDLSSTIRYRRDELLDFSIYVGRFLCFIWLELPLYFFRKGKKGLGIRSFCSEITTYLVIFSMCRYHLRASIFVLLLPLLQMRIGMMVGNWGQHAFVDEVEPDSDFRSSISLIDVPSNRFCFNDGWHTSHHLNPRRHWRDHPLAFMKAKKQYKDGRALVFHNIDYIMITYKLMVKDYDYLAQCLVPIGDQTKLDHNGIVELLKTKTKKFTEEDIRKRFTKP